MKNEIYGKRSAHVSHRRRFPNISLR